MGIKRIKKHIVQPKKFTRLEGVLHGIKFDEKEIEKAKNSIFRFDE